MIDRSWSAVDKLSDFYVENATTFFTNTFLDSFKSRYYEFDRLNDKISSASSVKDVGIVDDDKIMGMGIYYQVDYLSEYFGKEIGVLDGLVIDKKIEKIKKIEVADYLLWFIFTEIKSHYDFLSVNVPSGSIELIRVLERYGFYYAEGFNNMEGMLDNANEPLILGDTVIRGAKEGDFKKLEKIYLESNFPSHLVTDPFFDEQKAKRLYVNNFRKTWEEGNGKVWVAEVDGDFAGALIGKIDWELYQKTQIITNARSGMGIIVNPKYRHQKVAQQLLIERDNWYKDQGVKCQILGANISNAPMIRLLEKKGFRHASATITMHKKL